MSDFGIFEAAVTNEDDAERARREAGAKLDAAIYDVRENFPFLMAATGLDDFGDRWHLALKDIRRTVEAAGVFPASGPMGKIQRTLRREVKARLERKAESDWREMARPMLEGLGHGLSVDDQPDVPGVMDDFLRGVAEGIKAEIPDMGPVPDTEGMTLQDVLPLIQGLGSGVLQANRRTAARPLHEIARDIKNTWPKVNYAAQPYLEAMSELNDINDMYYQDPASHIVNYFLSNSSGWRGEDAKRIKSELKSLVGRSAAVSELGYDWPQDEDKDEYRPDPRDWSDDEKKKTKEKDKKKAGVDEGEPLIPEGDFKGYLDDVAPQAEPSAERNMSATPFPGAQKHDHDPAKTLFARQSRQAALRRFAAWCQRTGRNANHPDSLELYSFVCGDDQPVVISALRRLAEEEKQAPAAEQAPQEGQPPAEGEGGDPQAQIEQLIEAFLQFCQQMGLQPSPEAVQAFAQQAGLPPEAVQVLTQVIQQAGGAQPAQGAPQGAPPAGTTPPAGPPQPMARRQAGVELKNVTIADKAKNLFKGEDESGNTVVFRASDEDAKQLREVMFGDLAVNFSGVTVDEADIVKQGSLGKAEAPARGRTAQQPPAPLENQAVENNLLDTALQAVQEMQMREQAEFEQINQALEQASQALQVAIQVEHAEHPMNVTSPEGTVQVRPDSPEQVMQQQGIPAEAPPQDPMAGTPAPELLQAKINWKKVPNDGYPQGADGGNMTKEEQAEYKKQQDQEHGLEHEAGFKNDVAPVIGGGGPREPWVEDYLRWTSENQLDPGDEKNYSNWGKKQRQSGRAPIVRNSRLTNGGRYDNVSGSKYAGLAELPDELLQELLQEIRKVRPLTENPEQFLGESFDRAMDAPVTASRKEAWTGWGPAQPGAMKVAGWKWDNYLNGYVASSPHRFSCSCGSQFDVPSYHNCRCGKVWNSYPIGTSAGEHREASIDQWVCREVTGGVGVIMANKQRAAASEEEDGPITEYDGDRGKKETRKPPSTKVEQPPHDWARRDRDGTWTGPAVGPKRR